MYIPVYCTWMCKCTVSVCVCVRVHVLVWYYTSLDWNYLSARDSVLHQFTRQGKIMFFTPDFFFTSTPTFSHIHILIKIVSAFQNRQVFP